MACSLSPLVGIHWFFLGSPWLWPGATLGQPVTPEAPAVTRQAGSNWPVPESCEDDFDCNGGSWAAVFGFGPLERGWVGHGLGMEKALRMTDIFRQGALTLAEAMTFSRIKTITSCAKSIGCSFFNSGHTRHGWLLIYFIYFYMFTHFHWSHTTSLLAMWIYHDL